MPKPTTWDRHRQSTPEEYILSRVDVDPDTGCWLWPGSVTTAGYAHAKLGGRWVCGHTLAYRTFVGPVPDGLTLDHLCRVKHCVNPEHLEPVTHQENMRRAFMAKYPDWSGDESVFPSCGHPRPHKKRACLICRYKPRGAR